MNNTRVTVLAIWALCLIASAWIILTRLELITNVAQFMPEAKTPAEKLLVDQLHQGAAARIILIAIEGGQLPELTDISKQLAKRLRAGESFTRVDNGEQVFRSLENTPLFRYRYLLSPNITPQYFSADNLKNILQQRLLDLTSPVGLFSKQLLPKDPSNEIGTLGRLLASQDNTTRQFGVWVSPDRKRALLLAETRAQGYDLDAQIVAIESINIEFNQLINTATVRKNEAQPPRLLLSGPSVFATNSRNQIQKEVTSLSLLASAVVMLILLLAYRNLGLMLLSAIPLLSALLIASAILTLIFGPIHGITMAFGITILGVAIDYPIHLFSHLSGKLSVKQEFKHIWPTLRLGVITTVAGYSAMTVTDFHGLAQLGLFAITGLLSAALVTRWVIPNLLPDTYRPVSQPPLGNRLAPLLHPGRKFQLISIVVGITAVGYIFSEKDALWENDLSALSPIPKQQLVFDRQLRADIGAPDASNMILLTAGDVEQVLQKSEQLTPLLKELQIQGAISDFDAASRYLPSQKTQLQTQNMLPEESRLHSDLALALRDLPFKQAQFQPFVTAVSNAKSMRPVTINDLQGSALGIKIGSLLFENKDGWTALVLLFGVNDSELIAAKLQSLADDNVYYLNFKTATNQLIQGFREETLVRIQWATVFILVVLVLGIRSAQRVAAALLPVVLAITTTIAVLLLFGESLSLFNLVALLLVFGIGIDYGLFFSRQEDEAVMRLRTFHALSVCAISTVSVFGILSLSTMPVLKDLGITVWVGVLFSYVFSMLVAQQAVKRQEPGIL